ncbi:MAG: phosphate/phosphite/phosphonate ABC transporter substrate-binding protein [Woeseiaceae bacterium]|nr:phosphate/phosphite/phosphonate ABC transporter substrate-binding protein [Woeseiaceae bacterium]
MIIAVFLVASACTGDAPPDDIADTIRVGVLPDQVPDNLRTRHEPLIAYLGETTGFSFELVIPSDYADLLQQFAVGDVDLAWFGGLTFVRAELHAGAIPLALRDVDIQFTSCYLAGASGQRTSIAAFEGARFSFGPDLSTSGHLMPRYFMSQAGLVPEDFFQSIRHAPGHDQTAAWVADGTVDLGVANCVIVQSLFANGQLDEDEVRIIETTPPYSDYVWAARESMSAPRRAAILDALLALDPTVPLHREVLRLQGANAYLPAGSGDLEFVRAAALQAGLLAGEDSR